MTNQNNFEPTHLFTRVESPVNKSQRVRKLLLTTSGFVVPFALVWALLGFLFDYPITGMINLGVAIAATMAALLAYGERLRLASHFFFLSAACYLVGLAIMVDGTARDGGAIHFYWFTMAVAAIVLFDVDRLLKWIYVVSALLMIFLSHWDLVWGPPLEPLGPDMAMAAEAWILGAVFIIVVGIIQTFKSDVQATERALQESNDRVEAILENILPTSIADRLKSGGQTFADGFAQCTILFADIEGFTQMADIEAPEEVVQLLNRLFGLFDELSISHEVEKIKTIGDAYMVASGVPQQTPDHASRIADFALAMRDAVEKFDQVDVRIGINSGPVVAGLIGKHRFIYDLWGDSVNIASRMESQGTSNEIQVSDATYRILKDDYDFEPRGEIDVKGKGTMSTWYLRGKKN